MSNLQIPVVNQAQTVSSSQCLTGCMYQLVPSPGPQGRNILNLIPILKSQDNTVPVIAASTIPNARTLNVQQPIRFSALNIQQPSAVSNVSLPCQVNSSLIQQLGTGKYFITTQKSPADTSKTIRVNSTLSTPQGTAVVLENSGINLPSTSNPGAPTFIMMNTNTQSLPLKTVPFLPSGHGLQIPAHAEVKTVPASSLPFSIQQRILPQLNGNDATKIPSVIYVSPVNTIKTSDNKTPPSSPKLNSISPAVKHSQVIPALTPTSQSGKTEPPKGPMKWVVQETKESAACIVPVTSSNTTASKLLKMMSGTKAKDINLLNTSTSKMVQIKDNALVMCNNKIYLLTKQGAELRGSVGVKAETSNNTTVTTEQKKDSSIMPTHAVKSASPSTPKQTCNSSRGPVFSLNTDSAAKSRTSTASKTNGTASEVIYIDDDDDEVNVENIQEPPAPSHNKPDKTNSIKSSTPAMLRVYYSNKKCNQVQNRPNKASSMNLCTPTTLLDYGSKRKDDQLNSRQNKTSSINVCNAAVPRAYGSVTKDDHVHSQASKKSSIKICPTTATSDCGSNIKDDQAKEKHRMKSAENPVKNIIDDESLRAKFGLDKIEKIILNRIPLLRLENKSESKRPLDPDDNLYLKDRAQSESLDKRKSTFSEMDSPSKRRKSADPDLNQNTLESNYSVSSSTSTTTPVSSSYVAQSSGQKQCSSPIFIETETDPDHKSAGVTEMYKDPADSDLYFFGQDITGHFTEASVPSQRFFIESSAYPDETTKDEKIQRLKEVLKEREQALEALRRLKRP